MSLHFKELVNEFQLQNRAWKKKFMKFSEIKQIEFSTMNSLIEVYKI